MSKPIPYSDLKMNGEGFYTIGNKPQVINILTLKGKPYDPNRPVLDQQNDPESSLYSANIRPTLKPTQETK